VRDDFVSKLSRITQLTGESRLPTAILDTTYVDISGFSDPVYAEAVVTISQFDILLGKLPFRTKTQSSLSSEQTFS
jgi:vesicle coat complex subunit